MAVLVCRWVVTYNVRLCVSIILNHLYDPYLPLPYP
jgi:hypothetical protein